MKKPFNLESRALPIVLLTVFIDVLGIGILIPVLPQLVFDIFMPAGFSMAAAFITLGWLSGIYPLMQFLSTPIMGQLSDRYGRKKVLAFSLTGTALGYIIFAIGLLTKNISLIFLGRAIDGITGGNISVARAVVADVSTPKHRVRNFGLVGATFGVGFVMGPYIGARLATANADFFGLFATPSWFGLSTPFWFAAIISVINVWLVLTVLPETHKQLNAKLQLAWNKALTNIRKAAARPGLRVVFSATFLFYSGFTFFTTFFQILLIQKLGFTTSNVGDFFAYVGLWSVITQAAIVPQVAKHFKSHQIIRFALFGASIALLLQLWPANTVQLLLVAPLISLFNGLIIPNVTALVSASANSQEQGEVLGIEASVHALAQAIPAIMSGYIATMGTSIPVVVGGLFILGAAIVFSFFYNVPKKIDAVETAGLAA